MEKTNFILKKDWLKYAESAKISADGWRRSRTSAWTKEERKEHADAYMKSYDLYMKQAATAPVRIVIHYEDGQTKVIE